MVVVRDFPRFCVYWFWILADSFSSDAGAKYRVSVCDVFRFEGAVFINLFLTILWNWALVGWPNMAWDLRAVMASWTLGLVYPL